MLLNTALLKHPINWVTVFLMTVLGMIVLNLLLTPWHIPQKDTAALSANSAPGPSFGESVLNPIQ